jgi:hypothetical protein
VRCVAVVIMRMVACCRPHAYFCSCHGSAALTQVGRQTYLFWDADGSLAVLQRSSIPLPSITIPGAVHDPAASSAAARHIRIAPHGAALLAGHFWVSINDESLHLLQSLRARPTESGGAVKPGFCLYPHRGVWQRYCRCIGCHRNGPEAAKGEHPVGCADHQWQCKAWWRLGSSTMFGAYIHADLQPACLSSSAADG